MLSSSLTQVRVIGSPGCFVPRETSNPWRVCAWFLAACELKSSDCQASFERDKTQNPREEYDAGPWRRNKSILPGFEDRLAANILSRRTNSEPSNGSQKQGRREGSRRVFRRRKHKRDEWSCGSTKTVPKWVALESGKKHGPKPAVCPPIV